MSRSRRVLSLACLLAGLSLLPASAQEHDLRLEQRFRRGVAQSWPEVQRVPLRVRCTIEHRDGRPGGEISRKFELAIRWPNRLRKGHRNGIEYVQARNEKYAFMIHRSPTTPTSSLQFVERVGVSDTIDAQISEFEKETLAIVFASHYLWYEPLADVISQDEFKIHRAYQVSVNNREMVRVEFDYAKNESPDQEPNRIRDGYLVCDPQRQWALVEYGATVFSPASKTSYQSAVDLEYGNEDTSGPLLTGIVIHLIRQDIKYNAETRITFHHVKDPVSPQEFYLTHYGLPEPRFRQRWYESWRWYAIGGAVGLGLAGLVFWRRRTAR